jgi:hypothetical protein
VPSSQNDGANVDTILDLNLATSAGAPSFSITSCSFSPPSNFGAILISISVIIIN